MNTTFDLGPDIEVAGDEFEAQMLALADIERLEDERRLGEFLSGEGQNQDQEINSCDALRLIDGVPLYPEDEQ